jgi:hypothetical protein
MQNFQPTSTRLQTNGTRERHTQRGAERHSSSSSRGSGNSSSNSLQSKSRTYRILVSRARCKYGDTAAFRPKATTMTSTPAQKDRHISIAKSRLKVLIARPSENATRLSLKSFDGAKTGHESAVFERPTDLNALSWKWSSNTCRESEVTGLSGGGKVAVGGGRSGIVLYRGVGYEGRLRLEGRKGQRALYSRW